MKKLYLGLAITLLSTTAFILLKAKSESIYENKSAFIDIQSLIDTTSKKIKNKLTDFSNLSTRSEIASKQKIDIEIEKLNAQIEDLNKFIQDNKIDEALTKTNNLAEQEKYINYIIQRQELWIQLSELEIQKADQLLKGTLWKV